MAFPFLTAEWRNLVVLNYEIAPELLAPFVPLGTELDLFDQRALVSIIAFDFDRNKLFGLVPTIPAVRFEEINLRFYVRRRVGNEIRRGVVFIKEIVPSRIIATVARLLYKEPYEMRPMHSSCKGFENGFGGSLCYGVTIDGKQTQVCVDTEGPLQELQEDSVESFILEHYWGYTARENGTTSEYEVRHTPWVYWSVSNAEITGDLGALYPVQFREALAGRPHSAFVAQGSPVSVYAYHRFNPVFDMSRAPRIESEGWVLFDGRCGFCSWWVPRLAHVLTKAGFSIAPLQTPWVRDTITLSNGELADDIRVLLKNGIMMSGADAYLHCMKRIRGLKIVGLLLGAPVLRFFTRRVYRLVNRSRFGISRVCKLPPMMGSD
jgi:uncharacterized protein YqjF (DUF2071 family)/predicted DCC family thiol-disulfide oxidoreductase YuxK